METHAENGAAIEQDANGIITSWDATAERLFGWSRADVIGRQSDLLIPDRNANRHRHHLAEIVRGPEERTYERTITVRRCDGHEFPATVAVTPRSTPDGLRLIARVRAVTPLGNGGGGEAQRYLAILNQISDGCAVVDLRGNYLFVNDPFCRMFNYRRDDLVGANFKSAIGEDRVNTLRAVYTEVYRTGRPTQLEYQVFPKGRDPMFIDQSVSLERDTDGRAVGFLSIMRDCTARTLAEQDAGRARQAAEHANRAKGEFLANMSHEIRTPMNGIIGMAAIALDSPLTAEQADCIATVKSSAESLLRILNDILDFAKIESRKLDLERIPFSAAEMVARAIEPLTLAARENEIALVVDVAPLVPPALIGDPIRLRQIVTNLVGNALKFTERGRVVVSVTAESIDGARVALHVRVADTGIGIPSDKCAQIFEPFTQADGSTTRRFGGTGLGLAISATLVQLMDGRIWVESEVDSGSTFHFVVPLEVADRLAVPAPVSTLPSAAARVMRILVADDNIVNQRVAVGLLSKRGHEVTVVADGHEAVDAAARQSFDLILMDVQMPRMGGFEATAAIRARERESGRCTRIVAMTAHAMTGDRDRCLAAGMDGYVSKPLDRAALYRAVESSTAPSRPTP